MKFDYDYSMSPETADVALAIVGFALIVLLIVALSSLVCYIFQAVGLHRLAKRRGLKHAWLAWLPIGSDWVLGCVSDQYQYVVKGKDTNRRTILLVLSIVSALLGAGIGGDSLGEVMRGVNHALEHGIHYEASIFLTGGIASLLSVGLAITLLVFRSIAVYDLYTSCIPDNNVLFLVLGIIFGFLRPFFIFACRNKDGGMPPRRTVNASREPWNVE